MKKKKSKHSLKNKGARSTSKITAKTGNALIAYLNHIPSNSYSLKHLCKALKIRERKSKLEFEGMINGFISSGLIVRLPNGTLQSSSETGTLTGRVDYVNPKFAYIVMGDEDEEDIWVSDRNLKQALDGDLVEVELIPSARKNRKEGRIINIVERTKSEFIGTIDIDHRFAFVIPTDRKMHHDIFIPNRDLNGAKDGQRVIVEIMEWNARDKNPVGKVKKVLGDLGDNDTEIHSIMFEYGLPFEFPEEVEAETKKMRDRILVRDLKKRRDFREVTTFTIDPLTAKDFDDAISVQRTEDGHWEIGVHIADVTHFVQEGTKLEKEAYDRATSVYLVDRTVPMLPEKLSNNLCSLKPHVDRLTFSAVFVMDENGKVLSEWFGRAVIHSDRRFTYEEAQEVIETGEGDFAEEIQLLNRIGKKMKQRRFAQGAISFESTEFVFDLDKNGKPLGMVAKVRKDAHKLVEEFMLLANRAVATFIYDKKMNNQPPTFVYRTHDSPDPTKVLEFAKLVQRFGFKINAEESQLAASLNALSESLAGLPEQNIIESQAIRVMSKAKYTTEPVGHYGLGFAHYTHFTSPIRRYPDVMVHRLLQHYLDGGESAEKDAFEERCQHSSQREKRAAEAERASIKYKQVEFMENYMNKEMEGVISGVTSWGIYVELEETKCEGMVKVNSLTDDMYSFDEENMQVVGRKYRNAYKLGDKVEIRVSGTDLNRRTIDFEMLS